MSKMKPHPLLFTYYYRAILLLLALMYCSPITTPHQSAAVGFAILSSSGSFVRSYERSVQTACSHSEILLRLAADSSTCCWKGETDKEVAAAAAAAVSPPQHQASTTTLSISSVVPQPVLSWISDITQNKAFDDLKTVFGFSTGDELSSRNNIPRVKLLSATSAPATASTENSVDTTTTTTTTTESVHLKLGSEGMMMKPASNDSNDKNETSATTTMLHTYSDLVANVSLSGLNVPKRKFAAWVNYTLSQDPEYRGLSFDPSLIMTSEIQVDDENVRSRLRNLWRQRRLLSDRTEVLAVYRSDTTFSNIEKGSGNSNNNAQKSKRGGFPDLLHIYAERLSAIIQDEIDEDRVAKGEMHVFPASGEEPIPQDLLDILDGGLLGWLRREYGEKETEKLCADCMLQQPENEQYETLQNFLEWFRSRFPYYYDRCDSCGASAKDDLPSASAGCCDGTSDGDEEEDSDGTFLGYVYPSKEELLGKASRTEIYQCHKCGAFTRFARYNAASSVIKNRRGRCGEYSMLLFRILRAAGHESRWVVDWADHVWAEVRLKDNWIHLDPCEAAVDKPLLYQEWGKQQTYIVAFHAPTPISISMASNMTHSSSQFQRRLQRSKVPLIEDVTSRYTSDGIDAIRKRRDESAEELSQSMKKAAIDLEHKLSSLLQLK